MSILRIISDNRVKVGDKFIRKKGILKKGAY